MTKPRQIRAKIQTTRQRRMKDDAQRGKRMKSETGGRKR